MSLECTPLRNKIRLNSACKTRKTTVLGHIKRRQIAVYVDLSKLWMHLYILLAIFSAMLVNFFSPPDLKKIMNKDFELGLQPQPALTVNDWRTNAITRGIMPSSQRRHWQAACGGGRMGKGDFFSCSWRWPCVQTPPRICTVHLLTMTPACTWSARSTGAQYGRRWPWI